MNNNEIRLKELLIQKNTNIEIKNDIKYKSKSKEKGENNEKDFNNNIKNLKINENIKNNINNTNTNGNSNNSHSYPININGSLFTCGGNLSAKTNTNKNDSDIDEYKNLNNDNNNIIENSSMNLNQNLDFKFQNELDEENQINNYNHENKYNNEYNNDYIYQRDNKKYKDEKIKNDINTKIINTKIDYQGNFYDKNKIYNDNKKNYIDKEYENKININNDVSNKETENLTNYLKDKYKMTNTNEINKKSNNEQNNIDIKNVNMKNNVNNINYKEKEKLSCKHSSSSNNEFNYLNDQLIINSFENNSISESNYNKEYPKNKHSISLFLEYIDNILKNENKCYTLKESLSLREDMTFKELFCLFDYHQNKNISIHEFKKVCKNILNLYPTSDQIRLIFHRYDINKDEKLDLKEFLNVICPIKKEYLGILFGEKNVQKPFHSELSDKSKKIIVNLMKTIILNESNYYEIREKMKSDNFSINEVWNILIEFSKNKNYLNLQEFGEFLKNYSYNLTSYEIEIIFNKFDFDKDEYISFDDFNHEFIL